MPLKVYCFCGSPTEYTLEQPKFCSSCGKPFNATAASFKAANIIQKKSRPNKVISVADEEDDDDYTDSDFIPRLDSLDVDLDFSDSKGFKIGQIAVGAKVEAIDKRVEIPTKEQVLLTFQKEASALKKGERPIEVV